MSKSRDEIQIKNGYILSRALILRNIYSVADEHISYCNYLIT